MQFFLQTTFPGPGQNDYRHLTLALDYLLVDPVFTGGISMVEEVYDWRRIKPRANQ